MCLKTVREYLEKEGVLPFIFQNDKFTTDKNVKFTMKDSKLDGAVLEYDLKKQDGSSKGVFYIGFVSLN
jgi:hypothetical protein